MNRKLQGSAFGATAMLTLHFAGTVHAQSSSASLEEVIVTARRTEERLQDVPISITVFNQQQLSNRNVVTAADLGTYTPSLSANNRFGTDNTTFAIRGFVQEGPTSPSVAVYFADVIAPRANGSINGGNGAGPGSFFDLQNVQVVKGPQGTLFGRNTTGGAILLTPQKPTGEFGGYAEASAGNYDMRREQGVINIPFNDAIRLRLGVDHQTRDGYLNNVVNIGPHDFADVDYTAVRVSLVADLTPNLENYTIFSYSDSDTNGSYPKIISNEGGSPTIAAQLAATSGDFYDVANGRPDARQHIRQLTAINTTTWSVADNFKIKNIASYAQYKEYRNVNLFGESNQTPGNPPTNNYDVSIGAAPGRNNISQRTFTEELQFQGNTADDRFKYQTGVYFEKSLPLDGFQGTYAAIFLSCTDINTLKCTDLAGRAIGFEGFFGSISNAQQEYTYRNLGFYGQGTYKLTDKLSLTAGVRYTEDQASGLGRVIAVSFPAANTPSFSCGIPTAQGGSSSAIAANGALCDVHDKQKSEKPTWLIDLDYKPTDDVLLYGKYSRGYRQGNVNVSIYGLSSWGPEKVDTYEIGAKTTFNGVVRGTFNIAAFYNDFSNQQLQLNLTACTGAELVAQNPQCPFIATPSAGIGNAGKSTIKGIEVDTSIMPIKGLTFDIGYAYLDTKLDSFTPVPPPLGFTAVASTSIVGGVLSSTPKNKVTLTGTYALPLNESVGTISFGATYSYQSSFFNTPTASPAYRTIGSQKNLNLNANWNSMFEKPVDIALFATNVTREEFYQVTVGGSFGYDQAFLNPPRMYGARLRYRFGG